MKKNFFLIINSRFIINFLVNCYFAFFFLGICLNKFTPYLYSILFVMSKKETNFTLIFYILVDF